MNFFNLRSLRLALGAAALAASLFATKATYAGLPPLTVSGNHIQQNGQNYMLGGVGVSAAAGIYPNAPWDDTVAYKPQNYTSALNYMKSIVDLVSNRNPLYGRNYGWGARMIRFGLTPDWFDTSGTPTHNQDGTQFDWYKLSAYVDNVVAPLCAYCQQKGIYIILDTGYVTDCTSSMLNYGNPGAGTIWRIWDYIASPGYDNGHNQHQALRDTNVVYEVYNEAVNMEGFPNAGDQGAWHAYKDRLQQVVDHVRNDLNVQNIMLIGTLFYSSQPTWITSYPIQGSNIGYVSHIYPGFSATDHGSTSQQVYDNLVNISNLGPTARTYPVVVTEFNWFQNGNGKGPYTGITDIFGNGLRQWINDYAAGYSCWTYGEMLQNCFNTSTGNSLDSNGEDYGQSAYEMLWVTFFYGGGEVPYQFNPNGVYRITPMVNGNSCLDVLGWGALSTTNPPPVVEWTWQGGTNNSNQKWFFQGKGNGRYTLHPQYNTGGALDVANSSTAPNTDVRFWPNNGAAAQEWWVTSLGDGSFRLTPGSYSDGALDVYGLQTRDGSRIDEYPWNGSAAQRWFISPQ